MAFWTVHASQQCSLRQEIIKAIVNALKLPARTLTAAERDKFVTWHWHGKARNPRVPLLEGDAMKAFLNAQSVHDLTFGNNFAELNGCSSLDEQ